jgi:hypothetical protein
MIDRIQSKQGGRNVTQMLATRTVNQAIPAPKVERNGMLEGSDRGFLYEC